MSSNTTGSRSRSPNRSHQSVNRYGWIAEICGTWPRICATRAVIAVTAIAAMGTSVSVEAKSPMAASPASIAAT